MRTKHVLIVAALLITAIILPSAGTKAQPNVPTLQVDTLVDLSKTGGGVAGGAFFLPDGNIIVSCKDTPLIIDSKTGQTIRSLESCTSETVIEPKVSKDGTKFVASKMGPKFVIWDVPTGKIIKNMENVNDYCFLSRLYKTLYSRREFKWFRRG